MMRNTLFVMLCLLATTARAEQIYDFRDFTSIEVREGVTARVIAGAEFSVSATVRDGDLAHLNINQFGQWLVLSRDARWGPFPNWRQDKFEVIISLPTLSEIKALDHAAVTATGVAAQSLRAEAAENSDLKIEDGSFGALTLVANTGGQLAIAGTCDALVIDGGSGNIAATDLICDAAEVDAKADVTFTLSSDTRVVDTVDEK